MSDHEQTRQAIAEAISAALPPYMQARGILDPTKPPHWSPNGAGVQAITDAVLNVIAAPRPAVSAADIEDLSRVFWDDYRATDGFSTGWQNLREWHRASVRRGVRAVLAARTTAPAPEPTEAHGAMIPAPGILGLTSEQRAVVIREDLSYYARVVDDVLDALSFSQHIEREALEEVKTFLLAARNAGQVME